MVQRLKSLPKRAYHQSRRIKYKIKQRYSITRHFKYNVDYPKTNLVETKSITVEGWIIPLDNKQFQLRVRNNDKTYPIEKGLKRLDVAKTNPSVVEDLALYSGFKTDILVEDGDFSIEVDRGNGFKPLYKKKIAYSIEKLPRELYNPELSNNYPEHLNLIENRQKYYYEEELKGLYKRHPKDPKLIALYLPQFHPFYENDIAWGKGFTEWRNVTTGSPRFVGHQQPILPKDLGFYDLRLKSVLKDQINLAKKYGIYGFSFYYYWFSGKKLMETPLNNFLKNKDIDFNFLICWANENWTKRWDGRDSDVIISQEYLEDDPLNFIKDVEHILLDSRYIKMDSRPIIMVYRASELKDPSKYASTWREYFKNKHNKELYLVSFLSFDDNDPRKYGFDAALDFAPQSAFFKSNLFNKKEFPYIGVATKLLDINFDGVVADYRTIALNSELDNPYKYPTFKSVTPSWDNDARKKGKGFIYQNSNPDIYSSWLGRVIKNEIKQTDAPLIFINAWNEWAEGAILEPSLHFGHATLNRTVEVLSSNSKNKTNQITFPSYGLKRSNNTKLAIVVHLHYIDTWQTIKKHIETINEPFDLFITLNETNKDFDIKLKNAARIKKYVLPNRGRDVLPFLYVLTRIRAAGYEYVLKLHSKKSSHRTDGEKWLDDLLSKLIPDNNSIVNIIKLLKITDTGIIGPEGHIVSLQRHMGANRDILEYLIQSAFDQHSSQTVLLNTKNYPFVGGTMFWARLDSLDKILSLHLMPDDFQSEHGQIDGTTAHALERFFTISVKLNGKHIYQTGDKLGQPILEKVGKYEFAP
ncbi:MAG: glycoside hydrolase family 99-like domain-containing protein [Candidatus Saccharimonadales bacterium]